MSIRTKGLVFAMEEAEITDVEGSEAEIAEGMSEIDSDAVERQEEEGQIEDLETAIEEAVEDLDTLDEIKDVMEGSAEAGEGMSPEGAEVAEIAVEAICARLGFRNTKVMPSLESFGSSSSRLAATRISVEAIGERIKQGWEAVKKAIKSLFDMVADFIYKHLTAAGRLPKVVADLSKKVNDFKEGQLKSKVFANEAIAKSFALSNSLKYTDVNYFVTEQNIRLANSLELQKNCETSLKELQDLYSGIDATSWYKLKDKREAKSKFVNDMFNKFGDKLKLHKTLNEVDDGVNLVVTQIPLLKGKMLVIKQDAKPDQVTKPYLKITEVDNPAAANVSAEVPVLAKKEMQDIMNNVNDLAKFLVNFRGKADIKKLANDFNKLIDNAIKMGSKMDDAEGKEQENKEIVQYMEGQKRLVTAVANGSGLIYRRSVSDAVETCRMAMKYVVDSMKQYGKPEAAAAE